MAKKIKLSAQPRELTGRKVKRLRKQGILPANIFGNNIKSTSVQVKHKDFVDVFNQAGETSLVELSLDKKTNPVLITSVQLDPVTDEPIHVDFHQVDLTQKVTADIPVEIVGESIAVKEGGGILEVPLSEIEVEALPGNLPDHIEVDISTLTQIGDSISASDLKLPTEVELNTDLETVIVIVSEPKEEEVEEEAPEEGELAEGAEAPEGETETTEEDSGGDQAQSEEKKEE